MTKAFILAASLLAVIALVFLTRLLGLGGEPRIRDADHARELADEALFGFEPVAIGLDKAGYGALLRDAEGRVLLLRRHGTHLPDACWIATPRPGWTAISSQSSPPTGSSARSRSTWGARRRSGRAVSGD